MKTVLSVLFLFALIAPAQAQWGHLKVQFLVDGEVPKPAAIKIAAGVACGPKLPTDESLLVSKNGGWKNVLIFLVPKKDVKVPIHDSYVAAAKNPVVLDNKECRFEPHIATLWTEQKLSIKNSDPFGHNCKIDTFNNGSINPVVPPNSAIEQEFNENEAAPSTVACTTHLWMGGFLVIKNHPYMAVSDADGKIELKNIPVGEWTFSGWHEKKGYLKTPAVNGKEEKWTKGQFKVKIADKETSDFGKVVMKVADVK